MQMPTDLDEIALRLRQYNAWRKARARAARSNPAGRLHPATSQNRRIYDTAHIREPIGKRGAELWICHTPLRKELQQLAAADLPLFCDPDALNGYVAFPKRSKPRLPMNTSGLVQYIPVHGGVTWALKDSFAAVWGFDTQHYDSAKVPRIDPDWIRYQCHVLYHGLQVAAAVWPQFRREHSIEKRAEIAQGIYMVDPARGKSVPDGLGFEALLNLMIGRIG